MMTSDQLSGIAVRLGSFRRALDAKRLSVPPSTDPNLWNEEGAQLLAIAERLLEACRAAVLSE